MRSRALNFDFIYLTRLLFLMMVFFMPLVSFGDECVDGDCVNGKGAMVYSTGLKYTGGFKDGVRHGEGVIMKPEVGPVVVR